MGFACAIHHFRFFILGVALALCLPHYPSPGRAEAGCTNYGDYLHWLSSFELPGHPNGLDVQGSFAYVAEGFSDRFVVIDITVESAPVVVGTLALADGFGASAVAVSGATALIATTTQEDGLFLVDVSDPTDPVAIGSTLSGYRCRQVTISESVAYLTCIDPFSFEIVDISDPLTPVHLTSVPLSSEANGLDVAGDYAYVGGGVSLVAIAISDPDSAQVVDSDTIPDGRVVADLDVSGGYAYVSTRHPTYDSKLFVYSLASPADPVRVGGVVTSYAGGYYPHVAYAAGICYYGASTGLVLMVDVSNPSNPTVAGSLTHRTGSIRELAVHGSNLYETSHRVPYDGTGFIHTTSVSSPSPMEPIGSVDTPGDARSVVVSAPVATARGGALFGDPTTLAYVADGAAGVQVVDVTDPLDPVIIGSVDTPGFAADIAVSGSTAFVADSEAGLQVVDISVSTAPTIIGSIDTPGSAVDLAVVDTLVYIADTGEGLRIASVADPTLPVILGFVEGELTSALGVDVTGEVAYIANGINGLTPVNVSDPNNPWIIGDAVPSARGGAIVSTIGNALEVDVNLNYAYVTDADAGLVIVDVTDPANLLISGGLETQASPRDASAFGIFAYIGSGTSVDLADIRDPSLPILVGNVPLPEGARGVHVDEFYAYVAAGGSGLQVCPTQCGFDETVIPYFVPDVASGFYPLTVNFDNQSIGYGLSYDWDFGDGSVHSDERHPTHTFTEPGDYDVTLIATNGTNTDSVTIGVSALAEPATITSITDVPDDQGGFVYIRFFHSGYDDSAPTSAELYTIQRKDQGEWISLRTIGAYGEHYYTGLADTQGDGEEWETEFRVVAHMSEGNFISDSSLGYSLDNIAPQEPVNLDWGGTDLLVWDVAMEEDFGYHTVYGSELPDLDETAEVIGFTVEPSMDTAGSSFLYYHVTTSDHEENESSAATIQDQPSSVPESLPTRVTLHHAQPNPALGGVATLAFDLPREMEMRLSIFDATGRRVRVVEDGLRPAGRHRAVWHGLDQAGRRVPAGAYFARLEASGENHTCRVLLLR